MKSSRIGCTSSMIDMALGYYVEHEPSPNLVVMPRVEDAINFSKNEIANMIRDTPAWDALSYDLHDRDGKNTLAKKTFKNGALLPLSAPTRLTLSGVLQFAMCFLTKWTLTQFMARAMRAIRLCLVLSAPSLIGIDESCLSARQQLKILVA